MPNKINGLEKAASIVLRQCMNLNEKESILIVFDMSEMQSISEHAQEHAPHVSGVVLDINKKRLAGIFLEEAKNITSNAFSIETPVAKVNGEEPPKHIAEEMKKHDVVLLVTTKSLSHTAARRNACKAGARIASMPGITEDMAERTLIADYTKIDAIGKKIANSLSGKNILRITTPLGTDLTIPNKNFMHDNGLYHKKGSFGNLPAGEISFAPAEGKTNGIFIVDKTMAGIGRLSSGIKFTVEDGYVIGIEGKEDAEELKKLLKKFNDKTVYNVAELGIGTNYKAKITGLTLEDEKVLGTVHIALGNNMSYPGGTTNAPLHLDGVISKPTLIADNKVIIKEGRLLGYPKLYKLI